MSNGMTGTDSLGGGGGGGNVNVISSQDVWSYRHNENNAPFVDAINNGLMTIDNDFPGFAGNGINTVDAVELGGKDKYMTLGYWSPGDGQLGMNKNFTDPAKMNQVMDDAAASGFHPSRGNRSGTEAVALHEGGHALTDYLASQNGYAGLHEFSRSIVRNAMKATGARRAKDFAGQISRYAKHNYAETVAEAMADFYCNGSRASAASKAIMAELSKFK